MGRQWSHSARRADFGVTREQATRRVAQGIALERIAERTCAGCPT
jgi:hypothetical protein